MHVLRHIKTGSGKKAVQVVDRFGGVTKIIKHIGTYGNDSEKADLERLALAFIDSIQATPPLFNDIFNSSTSSVVSMENIEFIGSLHTFSYEFINDFYTKLGFDTLQNNLLKNLVIMRILKPSSKNQTIFDLEKYVGVKITKNELFKGLQKLSILKDKVEEISIAYAKNNLKFDFTLVFYDVTTLYYESFTEDEVRKCGFSKDHKNGQPQIMVGLLVNEDGYPILLQMFEGDTFEGHTIIPSLEILQNKYNIHSLTVVADAAMLSADNIKLIKDKGFKYIVGARLGSITTQKLERIHSHINKNESTIYSEELPLGTLIVDYSPKRATKDEADRKKQINNAIRASTKKTSRTKYRFLKSTTPDLFELNTELVKKDELQDGLKGYYTNLKEVDPRLIIDRYHDLWNV
jgi:transposase